MDGATLIEDLARARAHVLARVAAACERTGRDPRDVTLVAVSKTVDVERLRAAVAAGLHTLAENRVQEAATKVPVVAGATWHLVGHLQANKARRAIELFAVIQSVDCVELAERLDRIAAELVAASPDAPRPWPDRLPVLLQVNVDGDPAKAGFGPDDLRVALPRLVRLSRLRLDGLMTVGRLVPEPEDARATFIALRRLSDELREHEERLGAALSMGMSDDFEVAVEEGATIVRVGRALFGERPAA
jgi:PLP dependent protein